MESFFGIRLRSKPLNDVEYVEHVRATLEKYKRLSKWVACGRMIGVLVFVGVAVFLLNVLMQFGLMQMFNQVFAGFALGLFFGLNVAMSLSMALFEFREAIDALQGDRSGELMLRYHDALVELGQTGHASGPPTLDVGEIHGPAAAIF